MRSKKYLIKIISLFVAAVFLHQQIVFAAGDMAPVSGAVRPVSENFTQKRAIHVPNSLAQVDASDINSSEDIILNIQDCHSSLSAQYSIVNILKDLMKKYDLKVVAIEGASGYVDTSILRSFPDSRIKEKTADYLMKTGKISAGEFFSVTTDEDVALYGVEDNELYQENLEMFRGIFSCNKKHLGVLRSAIDALKVREKKVYSDKLNELVYKSRLHYSGKISLDLYWGYLESICSRENIPVDGYRSIKGFVEAVKVERTIDFTKATNQRKDLIGRIMKNADKETIRAMVEKTISFQKGKISEYAYHEWLARLSGSLGIDDEMFGDLFKYVEYLQLNNELNVIGLGKDLERLENAVFDKVFKGEAERALYEDIKTVEMMRSLFLIRLSDEESLDLERRLEVFDLDQISKYLSLEHPDIIDKMAAVLEDAADAIKFYEVARKRNDAMLSNTVKMMRDEGRHIAALISGGHHSTGLTEVMKERGLSYLVLMPRYYRDSERPYVAILTKKDGPYRELVSAGEYDLALEAYFATGNIDDLSGMIAFAVGQSILSGKDVDGVIDEWMGIYREAYEGIYPARKKKAASGIITPEEFSARFDSLEIARISHGVCNVYIAGKVYRVSKDRMDVSSSVPRETGKSVGRNRVLGKIRKFFDRLMLAIKSSPVQEKTDVTEKPDEVFLHPVFSRNDIIPSYTIDTRKDPAKRPEGRTPRPLNLEVPHIKPGLAEELKANGLFYADKTLHIMLVDYGKYGEMLNLCSPRAEEMITNGLIRDAIKELPNIRNVSFHLGFDTEKQTYTKKDVLPETGASLPDGFIRQKSVDRIRLLQKEVRGTGYKGRILLENMDYHAGSRLFWEPSYIRDVADNTGSGYLVDLGHVITTAMNATLDGAVMSDGVKADYAHPADYLKELIDKNNVDLLEEVHISIPYFDRKTGRWVHAGAGGGKDYGLYEEEPDSAVEYERELLRYLLDLRRDNDIRTPLVINFEISDEHVERNVDALAREILKWEKSAGIEDKDIKGPEAKRSDEVVKKLIKEDRVVEVFIKGDLLKASHVESVEDYVPGGKMRDISLTSEFPVNELFTDIQQKNLFEWMKKNDHVRIRIILNDLTIGWNGDINHANIIHAGFRDGCIYIGGYLLAEIFNEQDDPIVKKILEQDSLIHLRDKDFDCRKDEALYRERLELLDRRIEEILNVPPDRDRALWLCSGRDKSNPRIGWGNNLPADKTVVRPPADPVRVSASLHLPKGGEFGLFGYNSQEVKMKIYAGPKDNMLYWSEIKMDLVHAKDLGETVFLTFAGRIPPFFEGKYTFKYTLDGGLNWRWANDGPGDDKIIIRQKDRVDTSIKHGFREKLMLHKFREIPLKRKVLNKDGMIEACEEWTSHFGDDSRLPDRGNLSVYKTSTGPVEIVSPEESLVFLDRELYTDSKTKGYAVGYYDPVNEKVSLRLSTDEFVRGQTHDTGGLKPHGPVPAVIDIFLDKEGKVVRFKYDMGNISFEGVSVLVNKIAGLSSKNNFFRELAGIVSEGMALQPVTPYLLERARFNKWLVSPEFIERIDKFIDTSGDVRVSAEDTEFSKNIIRYSSNRILRRRVLRFLSMLSEEGRMDEEEYFELSNFLEEIESHEDMIEIERVLRKNASFLKDVNVGPGEVRSIFLRWFRNGKDRSIFRATAIKDDGTEKAFAIEVVTSAESKAYGHKSTEELKESIFIWKELSRKAVDCVPRIYLADIVEKGDVVASAFESEEAFDLLGRHVSRPVESGTMGRKWIVVRDFVEGYVTEEYNLYQAVNDEEKRAVNIATLRALVGLWKNSIDPGTFRGAGINLSLGRSVVVNKVSEMSYHGLIADVSSLEKGISFKKLLHSFKLGGFSREEVLTASEDILSIEEIEYIKEHYDLEEQNDWWAEEESPIYSPVLALTGKDDNEQRAMKQADEAGKIFTETYVTENIKTDASRRAQEAMHMLATLVDRSQLDARVKRVLLEKIDVLGKSRFWRNITYFPQTFVSGGLGNALYAFEKEGRLYVAEGFLNDKYMSSIDSLANLFLRYVVYRAKIDIHSVAEDIVVSRKGMEFIDQSELSRILREKEKKKAEIESLRKVLSEGVSQDVFGEGTERHQNEIFKKYAFKSHIRKEVENNILGRDMTSFQNLKDVRESWGNVADYLETVYQLAKMEDERRRARDAEDGVFVSGERLIEFLLDNFNLRKFVIGGGKGTRFSPEGIVLKQLFKPDGVNTNIKLSRTSAAFGMLEDVVVVDAITVFHILKENKEVDDDLRRDIIAEVKRELADLKEFSPIEISDDEIEKITERVRRIVWDVVRVTSNDEGIRDLSMAMKKVEEEVVEELGEEDMRTRFISDKLLHSIFKAIMAREDLVDKSKKDDLLGKNCIVVMDSGEGHGSAYLEALDELVNEGKLHESQYSIIVYGDSPGWNLEKYPNFPFIAYLKTIASSSEDAPVLPVATIGVKNPRDGRAVGRARVFVENVKGYEKVPVGVMEWNSLDETMQEQSIRMALRQDMDFFTNANVVIFNQHWAFSKSAEMLGSYKHDLGEKGKSKRRPWEYWITDMVNIAAGEYPDVYREPRTRLVSVGHDAPNANKTLSRALDYRDDLQKMLIGIIKEQGVIVDKGAKVAINVNDVGIAFSWRRIIEDIFADSREDVPGLRPTRIRGNIFLDVDVRVKRGAFLDGERSDVVLRGNTVIERGVVVEGLKTRKKGRVVDEDIILRSRKYIPDYTIADRRGRSSIRAASPVKGVDYKKLGIIVDDSTKIWLLKKDDGRSDQEVLEDIFGSHKLGRRVTDQIYVYGEVTLEDTVTVANGTLLDGRNREVVLLGDTHVEKGIRVRGVTAVDTTFAGNDDLDVYNYKVPSSDLDITITSSWFKNSYVECGGKVSNSNVTNSYISNGADIRVSDVLNEVIVSGERLNSYSLEDKIDNIDSMLLCPDLDRYVPGENRLIDLPEADREGIINAQKRNSPGYLERFIDDPLVLERAAKDVEKFLSSRPVKYFTVQQIRKYLISKIRVYAKDKATMDEIVDKFGPLVSAMRDCVCRLMRDVLDSGDLALDGKKKVFRDLVMMATRFNLVDLSIDPKHFDSNRITGTDTMDAGVFQQMLDEYTHKEPGRDGYADFEKMVFGKKGKFLYFVDNLGETEADVLVWAFMAMMGHQVIVAAKDSFAFGDIDVERVEQSVKYYEDKFPELEDIFSNGMIRVIKSGSSAEGVFPHRFTPEVREVLMEDDLKAVIAKGQANVFVQAARNRVKIPVVTMFLSKSIPAERLTGVSKKKPFWPIVAVVKKGESIESMVASEKGKRSGPGFGKLDPGAAVKSPGKKAGKKKGHALKPISARRWKRAMGGIAGFSFALSALIYYMSASSWIAYNSMVVIGLVFAVSWYQYYLVEKLTLSVLSRRLTIGWSKDHDPEAYASRIAKALVTPIAFREEGHEHAISFSPSFADLENFGPEGAYVQDLIRVHESFKGHFLGMLAIMPLLGPVIYYLHKYLVQGKKKVFYADYSNIVEVLEANIQENLDAGFIKKNNTEAMPENPIEGSEHLLFTEGRLYAPQKSASKSWLPGAPECSLCRIPVLKPGKAERPGTENWAFEVDPDSVFAKDILAMYKKHIPQGNADNAYYYDLLSMYKKMENWHISWPGSGSTTIPDHLHVHLIERKDVFPVTRFALEPICWDRKKEGVIYQVKGYPDDEHAISAFAVRGTLKNIGVLANRAANVESVIRLSGFDADKFFTRDEKGVMTIYIFPRTGSKEYTSRNGSKRSLGPVHLAGLWTGESSYSGVLDTLSHTTLSFYSESAEAISYSIKRQFMELEGVGLFPASMSMMVSSGEKLNCNVVWGDNDIPGCKLMYPVAENNDRIFKSVDFEGRIMTGKMKDNPDVEYSSINFDELSGVAEQFISVKNKLDLYYQQEGRGKVRTITYEYSGSGDIESYTLVMESGLVINFKVNSKEHQDIVFFLQKRMIDIMYENGMRRLIFMGAEPFLYPRLVDLLEYVKGKGRGEDAVTVWIFTNGLHLDEKSAKYVLPFVDVLSLPLDGYNEYASMNAGRRKGQFGSVRRVLEMLKNKEYENITVQVVTMVSGRNTDSVELGDDGYSRIGRLLQKWSSGIKKFQWKLNFYKIIGGSMEAPEDVKVEDLTETLVLKRRDVFHMEYDDFEHMARRVKEKYPDLNVRFSSASHDKEYLCVFPDGNMATMVGDGYVIVGNILEREDLDTDRNRELFREITDNIRKKTGVVQRSESMYHMRRKSVMAPGGSEIVSELMEGLPYDTREHSRRLGMISRILAEKVGEKLDLKFDEKDLKLLETVCSLHDLGAREKHLPSLSEAKDAINKGIHDHSDDRVEPTKKCVSHWANHKAVDYEHIPDDELAEAVKHSRESGDYYPVYRLYIKYVALDNPPEKDLTREEEIIARNIFSHGQRSIEILREKNFGFPVEFELLVRYHHDYNSFETALEQSVAEGKIDEARAEKLKVLMEVLIVSDVFEAGNNRYRQVEEKGRKGIETFDVMFKPLTGFMWKRFNQTEDIKETRVLSALRDLLVFGPDDNIRARYVDERLTEVLADCRSTKAFQPVLEAGDIEYQAKMRKEVDALKTHIWGDVDEGSKLVVPVGVPAELYARLDSIPGAIPRLNRIEGLSTLIELQSGKTEDMLEELKDRTSGAISISALVSNDVFEGVADEDLVKEMEKVIKDFVKKTRTDIAGLLNPLAVKMDVKEIAFAEDTKSPEEIAEILVRALPDGRSRKLGEKSLRHIRVEAAYRHYFEAGSANEREDIVPYLDRVLENRQAHFLAHYADGRDIYSGKVLPVGLEIEKRRRAQEVNRFTDVNKDILFIVAPEDWRREAEDKWGPEVGERDRYVEEYVDERMAKFKKELMKIWMLDGVIAEDDILVLPRIEPGYKTMDIYGMLKNQYGAVINSRNTGVRCITGGLEYDDISSKMELLQINLHYMAASTVSQYEVFVNLLTSRSYDEKGYSFPGLVREKGALFNYLLEDVPRVFLDELRKYYDLYRKEFAIKA